jgi:biotin-(acetyl-CoA carboxylase) ligase
MTVILRPKIPPEEVHIITLAAAVAVVKRWKEVRESVPE